MEEFRDYGMREYKAPLSLRIKNFFFTHPIMVAVFVAIIISLFMGGCDKARAEEMDSQLQEYVQEYADEWLINIDQTVLTQAMQECPYFSMYTITDTQNYTYHFLDLYSIPNIGIPWSNYDSQAQFGNRTCSWFSYVGSDTGWNYWYCKAVTPSTTSQADNVTVYRFTSDGNSHSFLGGYKNTNMTMFKYYEDNYMSAYGYLKNGSSNTTNYGSSYYNPFRSFEYIASYGDAYIQINKTTFQTFTNSIEPIHNNTPGFECYKLETKGGIYFVADFSSLIAYGGVTNTSTFSCDVHLDDTVQTITLNSESEYYIYDDTYRQAEYSFPITAFVPDYTEYTNVWIENVRVVNTKSAHGALVDSTFVYITPVVIMGSVPEDNDPITIPQISPMPESLEEYGIEYHSGDQLKELYNNNMFNQWITEDEFYGDIAQLGGGRSVKLVGATDQNVPANNTDNTLAYLENVAAILSGTADVPGTGAVMTVVYGVNAFFDTISAPRNNGQIDFNGAAEDYIRDNLYSSTYDIIVLEAYYDAEALQTNSNDLLYTPIPSIDDLHAGEPYTGKIFYVILTQRYIESLNLDGLGSLQRLLESDVHYTKGIYDYLYDRLNDFEDKSLDKLAGIIGVENNILDKLNNVDTFIQRIEGVLNRILDGLKNLHLSQLDTIDAKMGTIITKLDNIASRDPNEYDTVEEAIAYYKANNDDGLPDSNVFMENRFSLWFSGKVHDWWASMNHNGGDAQHPTASLLGATFDALKSTYESMTSETKILDNIIYFVNSFSDDDPDDVDTTYMTGLFKDNFDIDAYNGAEVSNE